MEQQKTRELPVQTEKSTRKLCVSLDTLRNIHICHPRGKEVSVALELDDARKEVW
jgi:hypothetical protein